MERGVLISGARCGTNRLERDGPESNRFGATSPGTCRYTISIPLQRLPEVVLEQVGFQLYRKHTESANATISRPLAEVSFKRIWRREANVIIRLGNPG